MSPTGSRIELAGRATRDLRRIDAPEHRRIREVLDLLAGAAENVHIKALTGQAPGCACVPATGACRYRPLAEAEAVEGGPGFLVARVVDRHNVLRAVRTLDT